MRLTRAADAWQDDLLAHVVSRAGLDSARLSRAVVSSRLAVREDLRSRLRIPDLFREVYWAGLKNGAEHALLVARPELGPLFARFGFVTMGSSFSLPVAGELQMMGLDLLDRGHLVEVRSPYVAVFDRFMQESAAACASIAAEMTPRAVR